MSALGEACFSDGEDDEDGEDLKDVHEAYVEDDQEDKHEEDQYKKEDKEAYMDDSTTPQDVATAEARARELFARGFDGGDSQRISLSRQGWDTARGMKNLEQLRR